MAGPEGDAPGASANTVSIFHTPLGAAKLPLLAASMTGLSALIAVRAFSDIGPDSVWVHVGWASTILFGAGTLVALWRMLTTKGPVITLTDAGLRDIRMAAEEIPWAAIKELRIWQSGRQKLLVLCVDPAVEARLTLTRLARWMRTANARLGADGLCVNTQGLPVDCDTLARLCAARIARARADAAGEP